VTSPATGSPSPAPSSSNLRLDIYLFDCGHGDTILIRLPDRRWVMVDCFLPESGGVRDRFFEFVRVNQIRTFAFVFQTHPDYDHYHGMEEVLDYFITLGRKIGCYFDSGLNAKWVSHLLRRSPARSEYFRLQKRLEEWVERGDIEKLYTLGANQYPIGIRCGMDRIRFVPLAPDPSDLRRITTDDLRRFAVNPAARASTNVLSLVIGLSAESGGRTFNALIGADAEIPAMEKALACWRLYCSGVKCAAYFDALKVPHHGSKHSHHPSICGIKSATGRAIAAVSAGVREALPDRTVLAAYLEAGWDVVCTTIRGERRSAKALPMQLADRSAIQPGPQSHLIRISWEPTAGVSVIPLEASVHSKDLHNYETAST
jgi:hypothetical protein